DCGSGGRGFDTRRPPQINFRPATKLPPRNAAALRAALEQLSILCGNRLQKGSLRITTECHREHRQKSASVSSGFSRCSLWFVLVRCIECENAVALTSAHIMRA